MDDIKAQWLAKLRSGEFVQGRMYLFSPGRNEHCCLGVLCRVLGATDRDIELNDHRWPLMLKPYIEQGHSYELTRLNDMGKSFAEIADYIEANVPVTSNDSAPGEK